MSVEIENLITRLDAVCKGMEAGLDDWPLASHIWEYRKSIEVIESLRQQNAELTAQRDAAMKDAERYRWLRSEHAINDPMASVVWKRNYDRKESEWVNTSDVHSLDHAIDAAIANCK